MGIHQCFGANLRGFCYQHASIAEVCKGIGINRQQFNKYLAGQSLPNAMTLRRICGFLKINEAQLFIESHNDREWDSGVTDLRSLAAPQGRPNAKTLTNIFHELPKLTNGILGDASEALLLGNYFCYFPIPGNNNFLMRSLVRVNAFPGGLSFSRLTMYPSRSGIGKYLAKGRHFGIVVANSHDIYFLGINKSAPHNLSFISFERTHCGFPPVLSGLSITRSASGSFAGRVCLQYLKPSADFRQLLRSLGPINIENKTLDPFIVSAVATRPYPKTSHRSPIGFDQTSSHTLTRSCESNIDTTFIAGPW